MPRPPTLRAALVAACALVAALLPSLAAGATPATLRLVANSPSLGRAVTVHTTHGTTVNAVPGRYQLRITPTGAAARERTGFCVDTDHVIHTGRDYAVNLEDAQDAPQLASVPFRQIAWLLAEADVLLAAAPQPGFEAAAIQVAVWQLSGEGQDPATTSDASLNARAAELRALAAPHAQAPVALSVTPDRPEMCSDTASVLIVRGTPGTTVALEVSSGQATLSDSSVVIGSDGTATATLAAAAPGVVEVGARAEVRRLMRARKAVESTEPQDTVFLEPALETAVATVVFTDCSLGTLSPGAPEPVVVTPPAPAQSAPPGADTPAQAAPPEPPAAAPRLVVAARPVVARTAAGRVLVVRVRNSGRAPARGVRVRVAGHEVAVGSIAPGQTRLVRVPCGPSGRTRVVARAANAPTSAILGVAL